MTTMNIRLQNVAEMFALRYLTETGQLEGEFMQEAEPPWWVWFQFSGQSRSEAAAFGLFNQRGLGSLAAQVAEPTSPPYDLAPVNWVRILKTFIVKPAIDNRFSEEILFLTGDQQVFFEVVRGHFLLQQGQVEFALMQTDPPVWVMRIRQPSRWVLDQLPKESSFKYFNQVPGSPGIFIEAGWSLSDPANGLRLNQLKFPENTHLLMQGDGALLSFRPRWQHGSTVVEVNLPLPDREQISETARITIVPRLRPTEEAAPAELWQVGDPTRLQAILSNECAMRFAGFSAWFTLQGPVWILASSSQSDKGLCSVLSDAFSAYRRHDGRVFLPAGYALLPRLSEIRLFEIFNCPRGDFLVIEGEGEGKGLRAIMLPGDKAKRLDDFIAFQAEIAFNRVEPFKSNWTFDFPGVKKNE